MSQVVIDFIISVFMLSLTMRGNKKRLKDSSSLEVGKSPLVSPALTSDRNVSFEFMLTFSLLSVLN